MAVARQFVSPQEYLAIERVSEIRHEYYAGQMYAMSGGSYEHSSISSNIIRHIGNRLHSSSCRVHGSNLRVKVDPSGLYTYPDALVLCERPIFDDAQKDTVLNPVVIFEVLSDSTEKNDRGMKFEHYRKIPSLKQYVLFSQRRPHVDYFSLDERGEWVVGEVNGLDGVLELGLIEVSLPLAEIYDGVSVNTDGDVLHEDR